ncbi:MAG: hypothetical protein U9Q21_00845 [Candidatus Auribacterota bacterium]|nr:hypothetical protein [Candidatus Auribacterota bacterium]
MDIVLSRSPFFVPEFVYKIDFASRKITLRILLFLLKKKEYCYTAKEITKSIHGANDFDTGAGLAELHNMDIVTKINIKDAEKTNWRLNPIDEWRPFFRVRIAIKDIGVEEIDNLSELI